MPRKKDFIQELGRCEYMPLQQNELIRDAKYNGVKYSEGAETYQLLLDALYAEFKKTVVDAEVKGKSVVALAARQSLQEIVETGWDIPSYEALRQYQREATMDNPLALRSVQEISFLREMNAVQITYVNKALSWLASILDTEANLHPEASINPGKSVVEVQKAPDKAPDNVTESCTPEKKNVKKKEPSEDEVKRISELRQLKQELYTTKEVCDILDVSENTLRRLRENGEIGYSAKDGSNKIIFTREDIKAYVANPANKKEKWR